MIILGCIILICRWLRALFHHIIKVKISDWWNQLLDHAGLEVDLRRIENGELIELDVFDNKQHLKSTHALQLHGLFQEALSSFGFNVDTFVL